MNYKTLAETVKAEVSLKREVEKDETLTYEGGDEWRGAHTAGGHKSKSGTCLRVNEAKGHWHCHSCNAGGDVINYAMLRDGVTFQEAVYRLAMDNGIAIPEDDESDEAAAARLRGYDRTRKVQGILNDAARFYHQGLTPAALSYYENRGITRETIDDLQLGWAGPDRNALREYLTGKGYSRELLLASGLFYERDETRDLKPCFDSYHVTPYFKNRAKEVSYFIGRNAVSARDRKYKKLRCYSDKYHLIDPNAVKHVLWNGHEVSGAKAVLVVEGIFDGILARQELSDTYDVVSPVTTAINKGDIERLSARLVENKQLPPRLLFCFDSEDTQRGEDGALRTAQLMDDSLFNKLYEDERAKAKELYKNEKDIDTKSRETARARMPELRIATLPRAPEVDKIDVADFVQLGRMAELRFALSAAVTLERYEKWKAGDPTRFFVKGARAMGDGIFRPAWVVNEIRIEGFWVYSGERFHQYAGGVFKPADQVLKRVVSAKLGDLRSSGRVNEVIALMRVDCERAPDILNKPTHINLKNGMLKVASCKLEMHDPYFLSTLQFNALWPADGNGPPDCPHVEKFLNEIVNAEDTVRVLEMIGYCMHATADMHKAFLLVGAGANGKSTLIKLMTALLKPENVSTVSLHALEEDRWGPAQVFGKAANLHSDLPIRALQSSERFKSITAGDRMSGERKYRDAFDFLPTATLVVAMNELPRSVDKTKGFFRRLEIINFPNEFSGAAARNQTELLADLTAPAELSGLAYCAISTYLQARARGAFTQTERAREQLRIYREESEPALRFFDEVLVKVSGAMLPVSAFYDAYTGWLDAEYKARKPLSRRALTNLLKSEMGIDDAKNARWQGTVQRCFSGVGWREGIEED